MTRILNAGCWSRGCFFEKTTGHLQLRAENRWRKAGQHIYITQSCIWMLLKCGQSLSVCLSIICQGLELPLPSLLLEVRKGGILGGK